MLVSESQQRSTAVKKLIERDHLSGAVFHQTLCIRYFLAKNCYTQVKMLLLLFKHISQPCDNRWDRSFPNCTTFFYTDVCDFYSYETWKRQKLMLPVRAILFSSVHLTIYDYFQRQISCTNLLQLNFFKSFLDSI